MDFWIATLVFACLGLTRKTFPIYQTVGLGSSPLAITCYKIVKHNCMLHSMTGDISTNYPLVHTYIYILILCWYTFGLNCSPINKIADWKDLCWAILPKYVITMFYCILIEIFACLTDLTWIDWNPSINRLKSIQKSTPHCQSFSINYVTNYHHRISRSPVQSEQLRWNVHQLCPTPVLFWSPVSL